MPNVTTRRYRPYVRYGILDSLARSENAGGITLFIVMKIHAHMIECLLHVAICANA